jgi:hypothetical protein
MMTYLVNNAMLCTFVYKCHTLDTEQFHGYRNKIMDFFIFRNCRNVLVDVQP